MITNQINSYGANATHVKQKGLNSGSTSELGTQDFLELLATQMSNQDVMNPMQDTQFISQMAQFTSLQAMQTLSKIASSQIQISTSQYGASLVGKKVIVARYDESKNYVEEQGIVDGASFASGVCTLTVNGKKYDLSSVMEVVTEFPKTDPLKADPLKTTDLPKTDPIEKT